MQMMKLMRFRSILSSPPPVLEKESEFELPTSSKFSSSSLSTSFVDAEGRRMNFHKRYASMDDAQMSLHVNGFYMMLLTSVVINLTETWGVDHGKIGNVEDLRYPRTACVPGGSFFCAETMRWYAYHTPSFAAIAIFAAYCTAYTNSVVVFGALAASFVC